MDEITHIDILITKKCKVEKNQIMPQDNFHELFIWVDEHDTKLGTISRGEAHDGSGKIHRAVKILIFNLEHSKMLMQQRSQTKDTNPNKWSVGVGGHVDPGETYEAAAIRELFEEMGIDNSKVHFRQKKLYDLGYEREFMATFEMNVPESQNMDIDQTEVSAIAWCEIKQLPEFIASHEVSLETVELLQETGYLS